MLQHKNFGRLFLGHHYYTLSLPDLCRSVEKKDICRSVEKKILKEIILFHYMTYMATPKHKKPELGVMKFTNLVDHSLVIITE